MSCLIQISAPNLAELCLFGDPSVIFCMSGLFSLNSATIVVAYKKGLRDTPTACHHAANLLLVINNVKYLDISSDNYMLMKESYDLPEQLPMFLNLTCLKVTDFGTGHGGVLIDFLWKAPNLEFISLKEDFDKDSDSDSDSDDEYGVVEDADLTREKVPPCFTASFKMLTVSNFLGSQEVMELIGFVFAYATVLVKVNASFSDYLFEDDVEEVYKLQGFEANLEQMICEAVFYCFSMSIVWRMDASDQPPSTKRRLLSEELAFDFISNLPDNVLHHIISFLSTKDAIRTSILSTRWRYVWTFISKIELADDSSSSIKLSSEFVSRVLTLHDTSDIKQLCLELSAPIDYSHLHLWIETAGKRNVRYLDLDLSLQGEFKLPMSLFTLHSLVVLKLWFKCVLKAPNFTRFSDLTTLHLCEITFAGKVSMRRLFLNCPVLDKLALVNCEWKHIKKITIGIPSLRSLTIVHQLQLPYYYNVLDCVIKFSTPNLTSLDFTSNLKVGFCLDNLSSLLQASVDFILEHLMAYEAVLGAYRIFKGISNVKYLSISNSCLHLVRFFWSLEHHIPKFSNLTHLKLTSEVKSCLSGSLLQLVDQSPKLELLDLDKGFTMEDFSINWDEVPFYHPDVEFFNSSLKTILISNFKAIPNEMMLLEFLVKNTTALKNIVINASDDLLGDTKKLEEIRNFLEGLLMRAQICDIGLHLHGLQ